MNSMYIDFDLDQESEGIQNGLLHCSGKILDQGELLELMKSEATRTRLLELLCGYESIRVGRLVLEKRGTQKWKITDTTPIARRHIIRVLNALPWSVGEKIDLYSDDVIAIVLNTESAILEEDIDADPMEFSEKEMECFKKKIEGKLGRDLIVDFDLVDKILVAVDDCIGDLYYK